MNIIVNMIDLWSHQQLVHIAAKSGMIFYRRNIAQVSTGSDEILGLFVSDNVSYNPSPPLFISPQQLNYSQKSHQILHIDGQDHSQFLYDLNFSTI